MFANQSLRTSLQKLAKSYLIGLSVLAIVGLVIYFGAFFFLPEQSAKLLADFTREVSFNEILIYTLVGFAAQLIDGALGMAYGVSSSSFLISTGVSPALASASVHVAEVFTTAASGASHIKMGNVSRSLFLKLAIPGAIGAALGAYILTSFDAGFIKPYVSFYLLLMGIYIIIKAFRKIVVTRPFKGAPFLALFGGFADASGGGGWGPIVTTTLIGAGNDLRKTIGSVNAAEFVVTLAASTVFISIMSWTVVAVIIGLIIGGVFAAPLGAFMVRYVNVKWAMVFVGSLVVFLSLNNLFKFF